MTRARHGMNRHQMMREHKRILKKQYARVWNCENVKLLQDRMEADAAEDSWWNRRYPKRNNGFEYWQRDYYSRRRRYIKNQSDKRIRQRFRTMIANMALDDIPRYRGADYEKEYDYWWELY